MIDLYYWPTPNGHKITLFLEEAALDYTIKPVNISAGDQFNPEFLAFSPNNRMPAIIDHGLADDGEQAVTASSRRATSFTSPKRLVSSATDLRGRKTTTEWLFWQMSGLGPMAGQNHHFGVYAPEKIRYAINRYVNETNRGSRSLIYRLFCRSSVSGWRRLSDRPDMATYPWIVPWKRQQQNLDDFLNLRCWFDAIAARPGTQRAYAKAEPFSAQPAVTEEGKKLLFGQTAASVAKR